eukprot:TRINITY_DN3811_c0_g1_i1.p1 TRINITY_DN3811_c0_g1~~TRINITY_DN3811_c0_g1_i1.p1  ORF type:complete len:174 (+),score=40.97 TRINITY_DN3811_c0_g1_i1:46-522(+)
MKSIMGAVIDNELTDARAEPRRALMFMCAQHERCGAHSHAASLGPDVARWIIELAKPISIQKACTAVFLGRRDYVIFAVDGRRGDLSLRETGVGTSPATLAALLPADECRLALFTIGRRGRSGATHHRLRFLIWTPSSSPVRQRMVGGAITQNDASRD